jgi:hypothetical protein
MIQTHQRSSGIWAYAALCLVALAISVTPTAALAQTMASSVSQHGVTWYFDRTYPVGRFATGDWWVVGPVSVVLIDPPSTTTSGRVLNGSVINPSVSNLHGYDSNSGQAANYYRSELNVGLGISAASPLVLNPGTSLVSTISHQSPSDANRPTRRAAILTVLGEIPPANHFRPPYVGTDKTVRHDASSVRSHLLPVLTKTTSVPGISSVFTSTLTHMDDGTKWQRSHKIPTENNAAYGRDVSHKFDLILGVLISDYPAEDKQDALYWLIQAGIDLYGITQWSLDNNVQPFSADGGWSSGRKMPIVFAGYMLNDSAMMNVIQDTGRCFFQEDAMYIHIDQEYIDETNGPNWKPYKESGKGEQRYSQAMLGMPEWSFVSCRHNPERKYEANANWGSNGYRIVGNMHVHHIVALGMLAMGLKQEWGNDAFFDFAHRYVAVMEGSADPFGAGTYVSVNDVPDSNGAPGWTQYWSSEWRYDMFKEHWDMYYPGGEPPMPPTLFVED